MLMPSTGPIVRISPWEIHIIDPDFFDQMYNMTKKLDKDPWYYRFLNRNYSTFATNDADIHRTRRGGIAKFFSSVSIARVEPLPINRVELMCRRMEEYRLVKIPIPLSDAFRCFATDVVTEYAVPESPTMLELPDYAADFALFLRNMSHLAVWIRQFPFITPFFEIIPALSLPN